MTAFFKNPLKNLFSKIHKKICERGQKCSCWFDGWFSKDWSLCCKEHDIDYKNLKKGDSTKESDKKFLKCLKSKANLGMAYLMYSVVRIFGRKYKDV